MGPAVVDDDLKRRFTYFASLLSHKFYNLINSLLLVSLGRFEKQGKHVLTKPLAAGMPPASIHGCIHCVFRKNMFPLFGHNYLHR